ncbi:MAG: formylglycine-generating enzyme family protein [Polyangiaceae bacterium]|nr:formylglycine-generating enzyme family protein [Polyangiaceae bacterium]
MSKKTLPGWLWLAALAVAPGASSGGCPAGMAAIEGRYCIDRFEAALEQLDAEAPPREHPHSRPVEGKRVRAISEAGRFPQSYISQQEAAEACRLAGKRLCSGAEWQRACRGPSGSLYPYGTRFRSGLCNDEGVSPLRLLYGPQAPADHRTMNDPRLVQVAGTVARSGHFARCATEEGVFDLVGNVHEWTDDPRGVFRGGYFLDTKTLGEGCAYVTEGHSTAYRDYSTGFRCCADL